MDVKEVIENWSTWSDGKKFRFIIELLRTLTDEQITQVEDYLNGYRTREEVDAHGSS